MQRRTDRNHAVEEEPIINNSDDRAIVATFAGALLLGLIYATKPVPDDPGVTVARRGDTAIVVDTTGGQQRDTARPQGIISSASPALAPPELPSAITDSADASSIPLSPGASTLPGSSFPPIVVSDIDALRRVTLAVPVADVPASKLVDSFDASRDGTRRHNAMDILAPRNTPVIAATDGRVLKLHNSNGGGLTIYASDPTERYIFLYGHLNGYRTGLADGMKIRRGEVIGFVGSTGNANPAGPHLHFQIARSDNIKEWWKGTPINPFVVYRSK